MPPLDPKRHNLGNFKAEIELLAKIGSAIPYLEGVFDIVLLIIEYGEDVKQNKKESREMVALITEIVCALARAIATCNLNAQDIDNEFKADVEAFHRRLIEICTTMQRLTCVSLVGRIFHKDSHVGIIATHRRALTDAITTFMIKDGLSKRILDMRNHQDIMNKLDAITVQLDTVVVALSRQSKALQSLNMVTPDIVSY